MKHSAPYLMLSALTLALLPACTQIKKRNWAEVDAKDRADEGRTARIQQELDTRFYRHGPRGVESRAWHQPWTD